MSHTWVVVANSTRARMFSADRAAGSLTEVRDLVHPEARIHEQHLTSDLPGQAFDGTGRGRHALGQKELPKQHEVHAFAREVADALQTARAQNRYERLLLVAAPEFLGLLRDSLDAPTRSRVVGEIAKNVVSLDVHDIQSRVADQIA